MAGKSKPGPAKGQRFGGRKKGTPNKITATVREAVEQAFNELGGVAYLVKLGKNDPRAFITLLARVLPTKVEAEVSVTMRELEERLQKGRERVALAAAAQQEGEVLH